jgi:hypothetical protein
MTTEVTLVADSGAASAAPEFFRCKQFLAIEGVTHTLTIESTSGTAHIPVIRREITSGGGWDAISPYGYPGGSFTGAALDLDGVDLAQVGIVSLFLRDRVGSHTLRCGRRRSELFLHDPSLPRRTRESVVRAVRKNESAGYRSEAIHGSQVDRTTLVDFARRYTQTMRRAEAKPRYFYSCEYFQECLDFDGAWLVVTWAPDAILASGMLVVRSDELLHYYLGGTAHEHRDNSPSKNTYMETIALADKLSLPVNFGGGVTPGDSLETFKRGFSNSRQDFVTHELVCDPTTYAKLVGSNSSGTFFPAYRASS